MDREFRTHQSRDGMSLLHHVRDFSCNSLKTCLLTDLVADDMSAEISWGSGLQHPHVSSVQGLSFFTIWWLDSKDEPPERARQEIWQKFLWPSPEVACYHLYTGTHSWMLSQAPSQIQEEGTNIDAITPWEQCWSYWRAQGMEKIYKQDHLCKNQPSTYRMYQTEFVVTPKPAPPPLSSKSMNKTNVNSVDQAKTLVSSLTAPSHSLSNKSPSCITSDPVRALRCFHFPSPLLVSKFPPLSPSTYQASSKWFPCL